jgi:hypothetical protein
MIISSRIEAQRLVKNCMQTNQKTYMSSFGSTLKGLIKKNKVTKGAPISM